MKLPSRQSCKAVTCSAWVFITMGPGQAPGSLRGLPLISKKLALRPALHQPKPKSKSTRPLLDTICPPTLPWPVSSILNLELPRPSMGPVLPVHNPQIKAAFLYHPSHMLAAHANPR